MQHIPRGINDNKAFGLIETSYVLLIVALITFATLLMLNHQSNNTALQYSETEDKLDEIERALLVFLSQKGRLPCPSNIFLQPEDPRFGIEQVDSEQGRATVCSFHGSSGISSYPINEATYVFQGAIPTRTLGISDEYMFDSWNNKIEYAVVTPFAYPTFEDAFYLTIEDQNGISTSNTASYFIVSHGKNQYTAYSRSDEVYDSSPNSAENLNSLDYAIGNLRIATMLSTAHHEFDDITRYKDLEELVDECNELAQNICDTFLGIEEEEEEQDEDEGGSNSGEDDDGDDEDDEDDED